MKFINISYEIISQLKAHMANPNKVVTKTGLKIL